MFISDSYSTAGHTAAADKPRMFTKSGQIDWITKCVNRIHQAYFIHEHETARTIDGVPLVKLNQASFYQNALFAADVVDPATGATAMGVEGPDFRIRDDAYDGYDGDNL